MLLKAVEECHIHWHADGTQIYYFFDKNNLDVAKLHINRDLQRICDFANTHGLTLNPVTSSMLVFGYIGVANFDIVVGYVSIVHSNQVKNLGISIYKELRFTDHITNLLRKAHSKLKLLFSHRHMTKETKNLLCKSRVLSHFNYCNYVYGLCLTFADAG